MSIVVAEGIVEVTADASGVPRKVQKDIESNAGPSRAAGEGLGKSIFGGVLGAVATLGIADKIGDFFGGAISGASDLNETLSKSSVIFGQQAPAIERWGNSAAKTLGLSKEAAIAAAAGFGDMFTQIGFTGDQAAAMSQSVVQAAADLGSFSNLDTADVTERIAAAFRGEYDSLQAVIPNINAARVEQEALAATGKKTTAELTAQDKAAAVLAIVHKDGARAMGDFQRTSSGAANQQKILSASIEDQQAKLGGVLLPIWKDFLGFLNTGLVPALSTAVDWIKQNSSWLGPLAAVLGVVAAVIGIVTVAQWAWNAAMTANPLGIIIVAIGALVAAIVWVATQTTFFQDAWTAVTNAIGVAWQWLWDTVLNPIFTAIGAVFTWIYNVIIVPIVTGIMLYIGIWAAIFTWLWNTVLSPIFGFIGAIFTWLYANVISPIIGFIVAGVQVWGAIFTWLYANVISPVFAAVGASFNWIWNTIISPVVRFITDAIRNVGNTVSSVFGGIASFIGSAFQAALSVVRGPINGIIGLVNSAISGINSLHVTIPAWVPIVGGQTWGLNIPKIPMLARGSFNSPDTFIAGERGPELVVGRPGSRVYPANETARMLGNRDDRGGDVTVIINESEDPLGSGDRVGRELRKWRKR